LDEQEKSNLRLKELALFVIKVILMIISPQADEVKAKVHDSISSQGAIKLSPL
jgi:hypothetical protein